MRSSRWLFLLIAWLLVHANGAAHAATTDLPLVRRVAVLVGANRAAPGRAPLVYSHLDAQNMAAVLAELGGFARADVHVALDPDPGSVLQQIDGVLRAVDPYGSKVIFFFYYSGHADDQAIYPNGKPLLLSALKERLESPSALVRIGMIDACRGGGWTRTKGLTAEAPFAINIPLALTAEGSVLISSSSGVENAHESDTLRGSFFTHHFIAGLRGAADQGGDGEITLTEAFTYANALTIRDTARVAADPQHPSFDMNLRGRHDLALTRLTANDSSVSVSVRQAAGPLELIQLSSGVVILEIPSGKREVRLALPPGNYLVRRRSAGQTWAREIALQAGRTESVAEESLTLVGTAALGTKHFADVPPALMTTLPKGAWAWSQSIGVSHGQAFRLTNQITIDKDSSLATDGWLAVGLTDRLEWFFPLPMLTYRFGTHGGTEWVPWAAAMPLNDSNAVSTTYLFGGGLGVRYWLPDIPATINGTFDLGAAGYWSERARLRQPGVRAAGAVGFTYLITESVALNFAASWAQQLAEPGRGPLPSDILMTAARVSLGGVQRFGTRPLPFIQLFLRERFSLDVYASVDIDVHTGKVLETYMGGFTWVLR